MPRDEEEKAGAATAVEESPESSEIPEETPPETQESEERETPPVEAEEKPAGSTEVPDRAVIARQILEDLQGQDYERARDDPAFMSLLVDAFIEEDKQIKAEEATKGARNQAQPAERHSRVGSARKQRVIDRLAAENADLNARIQELEARIAGKASPKESGEGPGQAKGTNITEPGPEPQENEFDSFSDYTKALAKWHAATAVVEERTRVQKEQEERDKDQAKAEEKRYRDALNARWDKGVLAAQQTHSDYDTLVYESEWPKTQFMVNAMMDSEVGPEIAYYLALHPDEAEKLCTLPPGSVYRAIGRIEARIEASDKKPAAGKSAAGNENNRSPKLKLASDAPPPIKPVGGTSGAGAVKGRDYYATQATGPEYEEARRSGKLR